jgi:exopolyphosphatase/guanosine-5'-triphosphate,3'-diphosphate pyrophosphatase
VRYACIDIGSNTTRLLVGEPRRGGVREVLSLRAFTHLGRSLSSGRGIPAGKLVEVASVTAVQARAARQRGAHALRAVGTAAIRHAPNRRELVDAVRDGSGLEMTVLSPDEEARLAFRGATCALAAGTEGTVAVVDVGGGSSELAMGTVAGGVRWSASFRIGSGVLAAAHQLSAPPAPAELAAMREHVDRALEGLRVDRPALALAVGGSAASLTRLSGPEVTGETLDQALDLLCSAGVSEIALRFDLAPSRVQLLPAGIVVLAALARRLERPLLVAPGGLREGVILELAAAEGVS